MAPPFPDIAEEIISNISLRLGADDIFAFRLACKKLAAKSLFGFATEYFSAKGVIFTSESLKVLLAISQSENLRKYLHRIYFLPSHFPPHAPEGKHCCWNPSVRQSEAYRFYDTDQQQLKATDLDKTMLTQALSGLPGLSDIVFADSGGVQADISGLNKAVRNTGVGPIFFPTGPNDKAYFRCKNRMWKTIMQALTGSNSTSLRTFATTLDKEKNGLSVSTNLSFDATMLSKLGSKLQNLTHLQLEISSCKLNKLETAQQDDGIDQVHGASAMQDLARLFPSLEKLTLSFSYSPSSDVLCNSFIANTALSKLKALSIDSVFSDGPTLATVLGSLQKITELRLTNVNITKGTWVPVLKAMQKLSTLQHLHLMYLSESQSRAYFLAAKENDEDAGDASWGADDEFFGETRGNETDGEEESESSDDSLPNLEECNATDTVPDKDDAGHVGSEDDAFPDLVPQPKAPSGDIGAPTAADAEPAPGHAGSDAASEPDSFDLDTSKGHNHGHGDSHSHKHGKASKHCGPDYTSPNSELLPGNRRGYYICVTGDKIAAELPTFIKEYNVPGAEEDDLPFPNFGPGGLNTMLSSLGAALGVPGAHMTNVTGNADAGTATFAVPPPLPPPSNGAPASGHGSGLGGAGAHGGGAGPNLPSFGMFDSLAMMFPGGFPMSGGNNAAAPTQAQNGGPTQAQGSTPTAASSASGPSINVSAHAVAEANASASVDESGEWTDDEDEDEGAAMD